MVVLTRVDANRISIFVVMFLNEFANDFSLNTGTQKCVFLDVACTELVPYLIRRLYSEVMIMTFAVHDIFWITFFFSFFQVLKLSLICVQKCFGMRKVTIADRIAAFI